MRTSQTGQYGYKIHLVVHYPFCCLHIIKMMMLIRFEPTNKQTIPRSLPTIAGGRHIKHYFVILFKEFFNDGNNGLFQFIIKW